MMPRRLRLPLNLEMKVLCLMFSDKRWMSWCWCLAVLFPAVLARGSETNDLSGKWIQPFALKDQYGVSHQISFPRTNLLVLTVADWKGSKQVRDWIAPLETRYRQRIDYCGIADLTKVPSFLRGLVRAEFKKRYKYPVMLDWRGNIVKRFDYRKDRVELLVVSRRGLVLVCSSGPADSDKLRRVNQAIEHALGAVGTTEKDDGRQN